MKKFLLSLALLSAALLPGAAQQRSEAEAEAIAKAFMQNNGYDFKVTTSAKIKKVRAEKAGEITPYFIFNDTQNGGFVIVGGQEGMSDILAYSNEECFNADNMPPSAAAWLEMYAASAKKAADYPEEAKAEKKAAAKAFVNSNFAVRQNVNPLLGEIKFNQGHPYNDQCPVLTVTTIKNGKTTVKTDNGLVGCSSTAFGMIMRYWKHPERPNGYKEHTFNYDSIVNKDSLNAKGEETKISGKMTIIGDFDNEEPYDWDNMLPSYKSGIEYNEVQAAAVSKLLAHVGIALGAGYGHGGTGAVTDGHKYTTYFGYDKVSEIACHKYLDKAVELKEMLADELSQGRPMLGKGSNDPDKYNGHAYVVDGFDINGLFHFNLGWDGSSNGYYEVAPVPANAAFAHSMTVYTNIHPKDRLTPKEPTKRLVFEIGGGSWNKKYTSSKNVIASIDTDKKNGETIIPIITADSEEDAENYLPGLSSIQGFMINRCDTITGTISQNNVSEAYQKLVNIPTSAQIDVDAVYTSDSTMAVTAYTEFNQKFTDADFRIAFVYTENSVKIDGIVYNNFMRGVYPNKDGFNDCLPSTIEADKQYIYESEIPFPASITKTANTTLIVMLIDGKTGTIVNANTLDLKQIDTWKTNNKPTFYNEGELLESSSIETFYFNSKKCRMEIPVRINNPWYQTMSVKLSADAIEIADNAQIQLGETEGSTAETYNLKAHDVDSTMMLYLNITDTLKNSASSVKLTIKQGNKKVAEQIVNFEFIEWVEGINPYTVRLKGTLTDLIPQEVKDTMTVITLGGRICGNDIIYMRDSLKLNVIDMSKARIVEGPGKYNNNYTTTNDVVGTRLFQGVDVQKIILPESAIEIADYAFNLNKTVNSIIIGNNVTYIGNNAFNGCTALEKLTIPASVTETGRNAFKGSALNCVICEGETPVKLGSQAFSGVDVANATLVVPNEEAVAKYKAANQWKNFGNIITYNQYTDIVAVAEETGVSVNNGKIIVANNADVAIYTFAGKLVAAGNAGEYALPKGNYIVKVGNNAVKVKL